MVKEWVVDVRKFRTHCVCETSDNWYPTVNGKVTLTVVKIRRDFDAPKGTPKYPLTRICVWGGDDDGMDKDRAISFDAALDEAKGIPVPITKAWLRANGFVQA